MTTTRLATCMLCEAACGIAVETDGDRVVTVRGDKDDPFSRGYICPKAAAIDDVRIDPNRVLAPRRRNSHGERAPVAWDAAIAETAERIARIQDVHGVDSVALYLGNPMAHNYAGLLYTMAFWAAVGSNTRFSATSVDQLPHMLASLEMFGHQALLPVPDVDRTDFMLILGANPVVSNGSVMTAPGIRRRLEAIRARGGKVVVVDPRRTETADIADAHHFIQPGSDALLLLAMLNVIFAEQRTRLGRLASFTVGVDALERAARPFTPDAVAASTGIAADAIRNLARDFANAKRAVAYGRVGVCMQEHGGTAAWLVVALNVVTGNLDSEGGMMFTSPAIDLVALATNVGLAGSFGTFRSPVRGLPEFGGELPVATLAEEIEAGNIRALVTVAGNPVLSAPNGARIGRALAKLDFMASIDIYENETTRHATILLPTSFGLERDHYDAVLNMVSVRNVARYAPPLFEPAGDVRHDWEIFGAIAKKLGTHRTGVRRAITLGAATAITALGPRRWLDLMLRTGPRRLSIAKLEENPHGLDLGPLEPRFPKRLNTKDKRIHVAPDLYKEDLARLETKLGDRASTSLKLVGRRHLRSNNSWMHNSLRLVKGGDRCTLLMHPDDATARGLATGASVRITSRVGAIVAPLEVSDEIARGVVSLPHGWGHTREGAVLDVARAHAGASINDLTDDANVDALSANASFSGTPVEVAGV